MLSRKKKGCPFRKVVQLKRAKEKQKADSFCRDNASFLNGFLCLANAFISHLYLTHQEKLRFRTHLYPVSILPATKRMKMFFLFRKRKKKFDTTRCKNVKKERRSFSFISLKAQEADGEESCFSFRTRDVVSFRFLCFSQNRVNSFIFR